MVTSNSSPTPRPLTILIAGAGIGGLSAAIALRQAGHYVQIFERSLFNHEYGAAVNITPNANGLLRGMGLKLEDFGGVNTKHFSEYSADGALVRGADTAGMVAPYKYPWQYIHRVDLHNALKKVATSPEGPGTPVVIHLGQRAVSVDPETGTLTFEDGTSRQGDLVIGADGVNSALRPYIDYTSTHPVYFGLSSYRFTIPTSTLSTDPQTHRFITNGELSIWGNCHRRIVLYPCRNGNLVNCGCIFNDEHPEGKKEWDGEKSKEALLEEYKDFHPDALALLRKADPADVKFWPLYDMPTLSTWTRGHCALMGDAAHPFLPFQGQGAAQAIEDGVTLSALLPLGTTVEEVRGRLELYVKARFERVVCIQEVSRIGGKESEEEAKKGNLVLKMAGFNFGHDARAVAEGLLRGSLEGVDLQVGA